MSSFKIYPKGYDPMVAHGPVTEDVKRLGCNWTPEDTAKQQELQEKFVISDTKPVELWYEDVE